jgi:hypothetical protein
MYDYSIKSHTPTRAHTVRASSICIIYYIICACSMSWVKSLIYIYVYNIHIICICMKICIASNIHNSPFQLPTPLLPMTSCRASEASRFLRAAHGVVRLLIQQLGLCQGQRCRGGTALVACLGRDVGDPTNLPKKQVKNGDLPSGKITLLLKMAIDIYSWFTH